MELENDDRFDLSMRQIRPADPANTRQGLGSSCSSQALRVKVSPYQESRSHDHRLFFHICSLTLPSPTDSGGTVWFASGNVESWLIIKLFGRPKRLERKRRPLQHLYQSRCQVN